MGNMLDHLPVTGQGAGGNHGGGVLHMRHLSTGNVPAVSGLRQRVRAFVGDFGCLPLVMVLRWVCHGACIDDDGSRDPYLD